MILNSHRSLRNFLIVNGFLLSLGFIEYYLCTVLIYSFIQYSIARFFGILIVYTTRNYLLVQFIEYGTMNKPWIQTKIIPKVKEEYPIEFHKEMIITTSVETVTHMYITSWIIRCHDTSIIYQIGQFIPLSFLFEIVFDFFHYLSHRTLHHPSIYKYFHKKHHKFQNPITMTTFYQDPVDLVITNSIPTILSFMTIPSISYRIFHWITIYKNFIEISGHSGKISYPTTSFPQFIWLPKWFGIELYTEDHDLHHSENNCNYSKRFSLWDKLFGTYRKKK